MKPRKLIRGSGGDDSGTPHVPVEANDTIQSTAFIRLIDLLCEGEIVGLANGYQSVYLNETQLQNDDGSFNFNVPEIQTRNGTQDQSYLPGFTSVENEISISSEVKYGDGSGGSIIRQITNPSVDSVRVRFSIPQLTSTDVTTGDINGSTATVALSIQSSGGSFVQVASRTVTGKSSSKFEFTLQADLTGSAPWNIKVSRLSVDSPDTYTSNSTTFESYTEIIDVKLKYPNSALIGIRFDATQFSSVPSRYYDVKLLKIQVPTNYDPDNRTYTGSWDGTWKVAWSDNPAFVFWDLLTNERYGLGSFIPIDQVDKWALYQIAQYCDEYVSDGFGGTEPRFTCNLLISGSDTAYTILQSMASVFRGMIYWAAGTVTAVQDAPQDPGYLYTPANVVNGVFTYQGASSKVRHTVALVTWNDPDNFYKPQIEYVEDHDGLLRYGVQSTSVTAFGCTSRGQAHRLGKWLLYTEQNESETVSFSTGIEGLVSRPGQIIQVSDPTRAGGRFGGRISAATTTTVTIDQDITTAILNNTLSVMMPDGTVQTATVTGNTGRVISVSPAFTAVPNQQGIWMLQSDEVEAQSWRVISIAEDAGVYTVTALSHDPDKFDEIEKDLIFEPKSYSILSAAPAAPVNLTVTESLYQSATEIRTKITFSWDKVNGSTGYAVSYQVDNENIVNVPQTSVNEVDILDADPGNYTFNVVSVNSLKKMSAVSTITQVVFGKTAPPADVQNFSMIPSAGLAVLTWDQAVDLDVLVGGYVRIRQTPRTTGQAWKDAIDIVPAVSGSATSIMAPLLSGTYMVKFVDSSGNFSVNEKIILTTVPDAQALNVVSTVNEGPAFAGNKINMSVDTSVPAITLVSNILFDDEGMIDSINDFDFPQGIIGSGEYDFSNVIDLGGVWPARITSTVDLEAFDIGNLFDLRLELVDDWPDWDGSTINDVNAELQIRTTSDDPASLSANWSDWKRISTAEYQARGMNFKLLCSSDNEFHNLYIKQLQVVVDMEDRTLNYGPLSSGTSAYTIAYTEPFFATPAIGITGENMATGDYYVITGASSTGFQITFKNSAGTNVTRSFYVLAKGYGRKVA